MKIRRHSVAFYPRQPPLNNIAECNIPIFKTGGSMMPSNHNHDWTFPGQTISGYPRMRIECMGREKWLSLSKTNRFLKGFHHIGSHTDVLSGFLEELIKGESIAAFWISEKVSTLPCAQLMPQPYRYVMGNYAPYLSMLGKVVSQWFVTGRG